MVADKQEDGERTIEDDQMVRIEMVSLRRWCCFIDKDGRSCGKDAKWKIWSEGGDIYDIVDSCSEHLVQMLGDGAARVVPISDDDDSE